MTPRPAPTTDDESAGYFLDAAAELIDAMFSPALNERPRRLRSVHFPAALEWLRVEDVVEMARARHGEGVSQKAFRNRWADKNSFVKAAIIHTMLYRDSPAANPAVQVEHLAGVATALSPSEAITGLCDGLLELLQARPRSYLLHHIGALLDQYPELKADVLTDIGLTSQPWYEGYAGLMQAFGLTLRPGWTVERLGLALQAMLDGFLLRSRLQYDEMEQFRQDASLFAETVVAFILGVIDTNGAGESVTQAFDAAATNPHSNHS